MCFSKEALSSPLTTLPSQALQTEAVKLFKVTMCTRLDLLFWTWKTKQTAVCFGQANTGNLTSVNLCVICAFIFLFRLVSFSSTWPLMLQLSTTMCHWPKALCRFVWRTRSFRTSSSASSSNRPVGGSPTASQDPCRSVWSPLGGSTGTCVFFQSLFFFFFFNSEAEMMSFLIMFLSFDSLGLAVSSVVCRSVSASASVSVASPGSPQTTCRVQVTARQRSTNTD